MLKGRIYPSEIQCQTLTSQSKQNPERGKTASIVHLDSKDIFHCELQESQ